MTLDGFGEHSCTRLVWGTLLYALGFGNTLGFHCVGVGEDCKNRGAFAASSTGPAADQIPQTWPPWHADAAGRKNRLDEDDDARTEMISSLSLLSDFKQKSRHHFVQFNRLFDRC